MKLLLTVATALLFASLVAAEEFPSDSELHLRHNYKLTVKAPFFYLDNRTIPFYEHFGGKYN
jgi:hypothetical protein